MYCVRLGSDLKLVHMAQSKKSSYRTAELDRRV